MRLLRDGRLKMMKISDELLQLGQDRGAEWESAALAAWEAMEAYVRRTYTDAINAPDDEADTEIFPPDPPEIDETEAAHVPEELLEEKTQ